MRKMKMMSEAVTFKLWLSKRAPKNSGMVALSKWCVMRRVRRPKMTHASREPMKALPMPIQVEATPNFQPNWPA